MNENAENAENCCVQIQVKFLGQLKILYKVQECLYLLQIAQKINKFQNHSVNIVEIYNSLRLLIFQSLGNDIE